MKSVSVVWFKRDLRLRDHAALYAAWKSGQPVLLVYCLEQEFLNHPDTAARHLRFVVQSLAQMRAELEPYDHSVYEFSGGIEDLLHHLLQQGYQPQLFSHQETGLWTTYQRDLRVQQWCKDRGVVWTEFPTNGIIRGLKERSRWEATWRKRVEDDGVGNAELRRAVGFGLPKPNRGSRGSRAKGTRIPLGNQTQPRCAFPSWADLSAARFSA